MSFSDDINLKNNGAINLVFYYTRLSSHKFWWHTWKIYKGGYDLTLGTSERGQNVDQVENLPKFKHLLVVFGGVKGLEAAIEIDPELEHLKDPEPL